MKGNATGGGSRLAAVLACLLVVVSALAVVPAPAAAASHIDGEISYSEGDGELTVTVNNTTEGSFSSGEESITVQVGGTNITPDAETPSGGEYTYTVDDFSDVSVLDGRDGSDTRVNVFHDGEEILNGTENIRYVAFQGGTQPEFNNTDALRFSVGTNFGVRYENTVQVDVTANSETQTVPATLRNTSSGQYLVLSRDTLGTLEVLRNPGTITISGNESYVNGEVADVTIRDIASEAEGERQSGGTVRFESPLFEDGQQYAVNVTFTAGDARFLQTKTADDRSITINSRAVAAEQNVQLTVKHVDYTETEVVNNREIEFATGEINGNATDGGVRFDDDLPNGVENGSVTAWTETNDGVERYEGQLYVNNDTLVFSEGSLPTVGPNVTGTTDLVVQLGGDRTLYANVSLQSSGGGNGGTSEQPSSDGFLAAILPWLKLGAVGLLGMVVVAGVVVAVLSWRDSGTTNLNIPFVGSSNKRSSGTSPGTSPGPETADITFEVMDEVAGRTYRGADRVTATPSNPTGGRRHRGVNANEGETITLSGGEGSAELECRDWNFEVKESNRTIGERRNHRIDPRFDSERIALSVEPYTVSVQVTGGPNREPLGGATVEATGGDRWRTRKPTDSNGTVTFEVPRSVSTLSFTATHEDLPSAEGEYRADRAAQEGVTLRIADETGSMRVETAVGEQAWAGVEVTVTPVSQDAKRYSDERTITTNSSGSRTIQGIPVGEYELSAHPQLPGVETTAASEPVTIAADETTEVTLSIGVSYSATAAQRERLEDLRGRIEELTAASNRDVAIPRYYGTVLTSVLGLVDDIESSPERVAATGHSPDAAVEALLEAGEAGVRTVDGAMSERRNVSLFGACDSMPPAEVDWHGEATLGEFLERIEEGGDRGRRTLRDQLKETDDVLDGQWGEVNEIAPARKVHDRVGELAQETGDIDDEPTVVAQTYVGLCLLDAVEGIFDHDALVERLNSGGY